MNNVTLRETTYSDCGQNAWAVEYKGVILFYLIRGFGGRWGARESLGRGYRCGAWSIPMATKMVVAKRLETAKRKVFVALADAFEREADVLLDRQVLLRIQ